MTNEKRSSLRGLSLEELIQTSTTKTPPAQLIQHRSYSGSVTSSSPGLDTPRLETAQHIPFPALFHAKRGSPSADNIRIPPASSTLPTSQQFHFGGHLREFFGFDFQSPAPTMPREQEPARNPLLPSQANIRPPQRSMEKPSSQRSTSPTHFRVPDAIEINSSPHPVFGKVTTLGASPQPFARQQPLQRPANVGVQRQSGGRTEGHSNLFITSKSGANRPDLHKPMPGSNPLSQLHKPPGTSNPLAASRNTQPAPFVPPTKTSQPGSRRINIDDDEIFRIPNPTNGPNWQPKPISYPTFSSQQSSSAYYQPQAEFLGSAKDVGSSTNGGIWSERYQSADPHDFMDAEKANEQLKALFEGAVEDDDKPRTRRRKKQVDKKVDDLADQINNLSVKPDLDTGEAEPEGNEDDEEEEDDGTVEGLKVKLLPHQVQGVAWMRSKEVGDQNGKGKSFGGILADDMGLGKTIQSIALMLTNPKPATEAAKTDKQKEAVTSDKGTLVVAPLALIKQWEAEIKDRVEADHALKVCVHHGPKRTKSYKELRKYDVVITTYSTLTSEHAASAPNLPAGCYGLKWYRIILDEAHSIKNRNAKSTKAACALDSRYRWCLTGTPMQNNLDELQSLIHFLRIPPLEKLEYWRDFITRPMNSGRGGLAIKRLQAALHRIMKRRTKDVLKQAGALGNSKKGADGNSTSEFKIVKRTVENVEAEFTEQERTFYQRLESRTDQRLELMMAGSKMSYASALVLLMRLRQACNHPKLIGSDLATDKDSLAENGSQSPRKKASQAIDDTDDLAAMLGGLSVHTKLCDVCQIELSKDDVQDGAIRCEECEQDLQEQEKLGRDKSRKKKDKKAMLKIDRKIQRRVILDSDDEDEDDDDKNQSSVTKTVDLTSENEVEEDTSGDDDDEEDDDNSYDSDETPPSDLVTSTKIRHLLSILRRDAHTHKYIVFSVFTSMLNLIEPFLHQSHIKFVRYDGSMRNDQRESSLQSLKTDPTVRVLLCSLRAGSLGLNLTAASRVVVLEPFWNPFVEEQAIDRVHRLNQTQDVIVYKMTIKDTVEARILELQEKKRALAKATIEGGGKGNPAAKLSMAEMLKLFDHRAERDAKVDMVGMKEDRGLLDQSDRTDRDVRRDGNRDTHQNTDKNRYRDSASAPVYGNGNGNGPSKRDETDRERKPDGKVRPKVPDVYARRW